MYVAAYNPTDGPVVIDADGRTLEGRGWGPVQTTEEAAKAALDDGRLVKIARPTGGGKLTAAAEAALDAVDELEGARKSGDPDTQLEAAEELDATPTTKARRRAARTEES